MPQYSAGNGGTFTPAAHATNANNWCLEADTLGDIGKVKSFGWGGRGTSSTGYRTRWGRPATNGTSSFTSLVPSSSNASASPLCRCGTFATAAILAADPAALWAQDWNILGGGGAIVLPIGGEWMVAGVSAPYAQVACGNIAGADANLSSYVMTWEE